MAEMQAVDYGPFDGGVVYSRAVEDLEFNELSSMENVRLGLGGFVEKRRGFSKYQSLSALGSTPTITACGEFSEPGEADIDFIVAGTAFYEYSSSAWTARTGSVAITAGDDNVFEWVRAHSKLILTNGVNKVKKWEGAGENLADITMPGDALRANHCAYWDNRLWLGNTEDNDDRMWYSANDNVDSWEGTSFYNFGAPITGIEPFQNSLSVHTEEGIWTLSPTGNAEHPYSLQQRVGTRMGGTLSGRAIISLPDNRQLFIMRNGIYQWTGGDEIEKMSGPLDIGYWPNINLSRLKYSFALYFAQENEVWFFLPYGSGQTLMNHIMIYNMEMEVWFGPYTGFERTAAAVIDDLPHAGGDGGILYNHWTADSYSDDSAAIKSYFTTCAAPPDNEPTTRNRWYYARTYFDSTGDYDVSIFQESSGVSGTLESINVQGGGNSVLGSFSLDSDTLSTVRMLSIDSDLSGYDPHTSLMYSNNVADAFFRVRHVHLHYKALGKRRKRKAGIE